MNLALLGYPLSHSLSPAMHNAALHAVGLHDWYYDALPVEPEHLADTVVRLRAADYAGANVTVPHKETIIPFLDGLTPTAQAIGAVNTIVKRPQLHNSPSPDARSSRQERGPGGEDLIGHNTDAAGLLADLHSHNLSITNRPILILGAGGSARAALAACLGVGAKIRLLARRREQAELLIINYSLLTPRQAPVEIHDWSPLGFFQASDNCSLIINATPLGMSPNTDASPWLAGTPFPPDAFVYDLVYNPAETLFVRQARAEGLRAATGLGMLVEQGALAFELWTGKTAPRALMRQAAEEHLASPFHPFTPAPLPESKGAGRGDTQ